MTQIVCDELGCFRKGAFSMVPYQHHTSKHTWKVFVSKKIFKEDSVDFEHECANVFAKTAIEAAALGVEHFERAQAAAIAYKEWQEEERLKQIKKQLKVRDGSEQTNTTSGTKLEVHGVECKADGCES